MNTEIIKIEPPIVVKEELEVDNNKNIEVKLENEEKPQLVEEFISKENNPSTSEIVEEEDFDFGKNECVYCGESRTSQHMTKVPPNPNTLLKWSQILGEEFHMKAISKKKPFICRSHFDVKWEYMRPHYVLPCVEPVQLSLHEVKKEEYSEVESFNLLMENHIAVQRKDRTLNKANFQETNLSTCCYCGARKSLVEMVEKPETVGELLEWYRILGERLYKNSQNSKSSMVCRSHFDDKRMKKKSIICLCAYCGATKSLPIMTTVPCDPNTLRQWGQILGEDFYQNALEDENSSICRSHFNVGWSHMRPRNLLPHAMNENSNKNSEIPKYINQDGHSDRKKIKLEANEAK